MTWANGYIGRSDLHCWGLVRRVFEEQLGINLEVYGEIDPKELHAIALAVLNGTSDPRQTWATISPFPGAEKVYDVVVMTGWLPIEGTPRRGVIHTGIVTRPGYVMHTDMRDAVVEVPLSNSRIKRRLVGCYRHAVLAQ
jgi:cell wall-associated NlpC family hydrolase